MFSSIHFNKWEFKRLYLCHDEHYIHSVSSSWASFYSFSPVVTVFQFLYVYQQKSVSISIESPFVFLSSKKEKEISSPLFWIHGIVIRVKNKNWQHTHEILLSPFDLEHWHKCQKQEQNKGNNQNVRRGTMNALNWYKIQTAPTSTACHQIHNISMDKVKVEECWKNATANSITKTQITISKRNN